MFFLFIIAVLSGTANSAVEFSLLQAEGLSEREGILLAIVDGLHVYGVTTDALISGTNPSKVCLFLGYHDARFTFKSHLEKGIPEADVDALGRGISKVSCTDYAVKPEDCYIGVIRENAVSYHGNLAVVSCGEKLNPAEYEIRDFVTMREASSSIFAKNPGVAVAEIRSKNSSEGHYGFICMADKRAADLACEYLGYKAGSRNTSRNNFTYLSRNITRFIRFEVQRVICGDAHKFSQCLVDYTSAMGCTEGDELVLECEGEAVYPDPPQINQVVAVGDGGDGGRLQFQNPGVIQVILMDKRIGGVLHADHRAMELICRKMGRDRVTEVYRNYGFKYLSRNTASMANFMVENVNCPATAEKLEECTMKIVPLNNEVSIKDEQLVLGCDTAEKKDLKDIKKVYLGTEHNGELIFGINPGVIFVIFNDESYGFVYGANRKAMDMICQRFGFSSANFTDLNHNYSYLPSKYVEAGKTAVNQLNCPQNAIDFEECEGIISTVPLNDQQIVLGCKDSGGDGGAGIVEIEFGGAELNAVVDPQEIRIDLDDIFDKLFN